MKTHHPQKKLIAPSGGLGPRLELGAHVLAARVLIFGNGKAIGSRFRRFGKSRPCPVQRKLPGVPSRQLQKRTKSVLLAGCSLCILYKGTRKRFGCRLFRIPVREARGPFDAVNRSFPRLRPWTSSPGHTGSNRMDNPPTSIHPNCLCHTPDSHFRPDLTRASCVCRTQATFRTHTRLNPISVVDIGAIDVLPGDCAGRPHKVTPHFHSSAQGMEVRAWGHLRHELGSPIRR